MRKNKQRVFSNNEKKKRKKQVWSLRQKKNKKKTKNIRNILVIYFETEA